MANFFQPGPATNNTQTSTTLSPAQQALAKFRAQLLGRLLDARAGNQPTFKSFVNGGPASTPFPAGMGAGMGDVLAAMSQPGAFTSQSSAQGQFQGPSTSMANDVAQMLGLGLLGANVANQSGVWDLLKKFFGNSGAVSGAMGETSPAPQPTGNMTTSGDPLLDAWIQSQYGGSATMIPGGSMGDVPATYPGLFDSAGSSGGYGSNQALLDLISSGWLG